VSNIITVNTNHMKFAAYVAVSFITIFPIILVQICITVYMVVEFVCFCLILYIIYTYYFIFLCFVYVFLLLCMFRSVYSVSLCRSVYCLCVNVYCTAATGC